MMFIFGDLDNWVSKDASSLFFDALCRLFLTLLLWWGCTWRSCHKGVVTIPRHRLGFASIFLQLVSCPFFESLSRCVCLRSLFPGIVGCILYAYVMS